MTVNGHPPTQRSSALWYYEQSVLNPDGPVRRVVDIAASSSTGGRSNGPVTTHQKGALFIPPPIETPNYDVDGNQTSDARWNYTWDGENRLIVQEEKFGIPVVQEETPGNLVQLPTATVTRKRLAFTYDSRGRRITKSVSIATGTGSFVLQQSLVYLYDGWNMIAEIDTTTSSAQLLRSYEWGTDISGTMTGAGGVGGLLLVRFYAATSTTASSSPPPPAGGYAPLYDGNGNITELFNLAYSTVSASYEYGAFGETISIDGGPVAAANPFRFSTKYVDVETGLYNYGYRYYDAANGRWLNRDPIGESGGENLYGMVGNDPVNRWDYLGLADIILHHTRKTRDYYGTYGQMTVEVKNKTLLTQSCCGPIPGPFLTIELPPGSKSGGSGLIKGPSTSQIRFPWYGDDGTGSVNSLENTAGWFALNPNSFKPKNVSSDDWQKVIKMAINTGIGRVNIHAGKNSTYSAACILIGTNYVMLDGRDAFHLDEGKSFPGGLTGPLYSFNATSFQPNDTVGAQAKLTYFLWCSSQKLGGKIDIQYSLESGTPPLSKNPYNANDLPHPQYPDTPSSKGNWFNQIFGF